MIAAFLNGLVGQPGRELELARRAAEIEPEHFLSQWSLGHACLHNGLGEGAVAAMDRALALVEGGPAMRAARAVLAELDTMGQQAWVSPYQRAAVAAALGERESALDRLDEAVGAGDPWLAFIKVDPAFGGLRAAPRFAALVARVFR